MKFDMGAVLITLGISLFCGIIIVAIGLGAALPVIDRVAGPLVCPGKTLSLETHTYSYVPGETTTTINWNCVDEDAGASRDVSFMTTLVSGLIYSALIFVALMVQRMFATRSQAVSEARRSPSESTLERLQKLKKLREADAITEREFEQKKAEILRDL